MADASRLTVDKLVLHHAVTPLWEDKSKAWLAQWFSDNGYARAYGSNPANWSGLINPYTGGRSYSQAHYAGQRVTAATPDATAAERAAGYRLVPLIQDVWGQITWHAGNWPVNQSSIGIENLGDYRNYTLRDGDAKVIAAFWRPQDQKLGGRTAVYGHKEVSQTGTECPARLMEMRDTVVNYINNPPVAPVPEVPKWTAMDVPRAMRAPKQVNVIDLDTGKVAGTIAAGKDTPFVQKKTQGGKLYLRSQWSVDNSKNWGVFFDDLQELPVITTKDEKTETVVPFDSSKVDDPLLPKGEQRIEVSGQTGIRTRVVRITYTDGKETSRQVVSDTVTKTPVTEVIRVGTYVEPSTPIDPVDGEDAKSWLTRVFEWIGQMLSKFTFKK